MSSGLNQLALKQKSNGHKSSFCLCRSGSFVPTQLSGRQMYQQSSKRPADGSAWTSMIDSSGLHPSSASCHLSWESTPLWTRRWPLVKGRFQPTCARTERHTLPWSSLWVPSQGLSPGTAACIWTALVLNAPIGRRSPSLKISNEEQFKNEFPYTGLQLWVWCQILLRYLNEADWDLNT